MHQVSSVALILSKLQRGEINQPAAGTDLNNDPLDESGYFALREVVH
jgi:hypothetical protein